MQSLTVLIQQVQAGDDGAREQLFASAYDELRRRAIDPSEGVVEGNYTKPRTWGVYRLPAEATRVGERFRMGNHPIRQIELQREFGSATLE